MPRERHATACSQRGFYFAYAFSPPAVFAACRLFISDYFML